MQNEIDTDTKIDNRVTDIIDANNSALYDFITGPTLPLDQDGDAIEGSILAAVVDNYYLMTDEIKALLDEAAYQMAVHELNKNKL